jgi:hypothetical protein
MSFSRRRFLTASTASLLAAPAVLRSKRLLAEKSRERTACKIDLGEPTQFAGVKAALESDYPDMKVSVVEVDGPTTLKANHGGMKVLWIYQGSGEVFLPEGYRTQEGGADPLPDAYQPDAIDPTFAETLELLERGKASLTPDAVAHVDAILNRRHGDTYTGDFAANLWSLEHLPRPWASDEQVEAALASLFDVYKTVGYATKQSDSFEPVMAGDQLVACGDEAIPVRGRFRCFAIEKTDRTISHVSTARRLRYLLDTAGGCSFDFDPYRRLPLTWYMDHPDQQGDGINFTNAHVVNIPSELSSTHFHPHSSKIGGLPQTEMYLVLDPKLHGLDEKGRTPSIILYPDLTDLTRYEQHELKPGDLVYIPPGVGHRGLDVFVNVLTIPGFKPHNEVYIDQEILDRTGGNSPYNENGLSRKNYERLEDLL